MSGHGGPRHALPPNPRHHDAGDEDPSRDRGVEDQEMRDQNDPLERARRLRAYHMRSGRCLYDQSVPVERLAAASSSTAASVPSTFVNEMRFVLISDVPMTDDEVRRLYVATTHGGDESASASLPSTHSA